MATCCSTQRCSCLVAAGPGVTVEGNGSAAHPYVVSSSGDAEDLHLGEVLEADGDALVGY